MGPCDIPGSGPGALGRLRGAGGRTRGVPDMGLPESRDGKVLPEVDRHLHSPCTGEHTRSTHRPKTQRGPLPRSSLTPSDLGFCGAPGRIRTCDRRIRSSMVACRDGLLRTVVSRTIRIRVSFCATSYRPLTSRSKTAEHERSTQTRESVRWHLARTLAALPPS